MHLFRCASLALLCAAFSANAAVIGVGTLTDALEGSQSDLSSGSVTIDSDGTVTFSVTFGPSTVFPTARPGFTIDIDQNPLTGFPGITNGNADSALMGVDYILTFNSSAFQGTADLRSYSGGLFPLVATLPVNYAGSTMTVAASLAQLGGDGTFNFKVTAQQQLSDNSSTGILDYMSELGQPVGVVAAQVPEPATVILLSVGLAGLLCLRRRMQ